MPWLLIAGAILLMAVRRGITLHEMFLGELPRQPDLAAEVVALVISMLMVAGLSRIAPYFLSAKRAEMRLQEHQHFLQQVLDTEPGTVYVYDLVGRCNTFFNRHWLTVCGYSQEETEAMGSDVLARIVHPDDLACITAHHAAWRQAGDQEIRGIEYRVRTKAGEWRWLHSREAPFARDDSGQVKQILGTAHDITEQKRAEEALSEKQHLLSESQRIAHIGSWSWDLATKKILWSEETYRVYGVSQLDFVIDPDSFLNLIHPDDRAAMLAGIDGCLAGKSPGELVFRSVLPTGEVRVLNGRGVLERDAENRPVRLLGTVQDITERKQAEEALLEAETRLRLALQAGRIGTWDWNMVTGQIVWSRGHEELWGMPPGAFKGTYEELDARVHPDDRDGLNRAVAQAIAGHRMYRHEFRVIWPDGSIHWIAGQGEPFFDDAGQPVRMLGVVMDITGRRQGEEALRQAEQRLRDLIDGLGPYMFVGLLTLDGTLIEANQPALAAAGLKLNDVLGKPFEETYWWAYSDEVQQQLREAIARAARGEASRYDVQVRVGENRFVIVDFSLQPLRDKTGRVVFLVPSGNIITERKRAEDALREHGQRLQILSQRLVQVQEEEARRIGRQLHDDLGQILTTLKIKLKTLPGQKDARSLEEQVADLTATVDQAVEQIRTISADLRPAILDDLGLVAALRWMLDRQAQQAALKGTFISRGVEARLSSELETTCFRVAQEALTNVVRHARAKHIRVELHRHENELYLEVRDDGVGFDLEGALSDISLGKNLGLLGMQERVALLDGRFTIRSAHDQGTGVQAWFPLPAGHTPEPSAMRSLSG